jgi:hypothetical protein
MKVIARLLNVLSVGSTVAVLTVSAQWDNVKTKGVPIKNGRPNFEAPAPKLPDGKTPDLSGIWDPVRTPCDPKEDLSGCTDVPFGYPLTAINIGFGVNGKSKEKLPLQPWAEALAKKRQEDQGKDDPTGFCLPSPGPRIWSAFDIVKILQTPDSVTVLSEYMKQYRQIFLDGRPLPKDPQPGFHGYSVGKWEGDTLVVETIGFKDGLWLDVEGTPLTDQARTIERIRRVNYGTLEVEMTINDPKAYTKPWTVKVVLHPLLDTELIDYICNEHERDLKHMVGK